MLQLKEIRKEYKTGDLEQVALNDVSLNLRDNEFVAILGPSGSGKTTLLNIIGGLDRYDGGDLIINGISTKQYTDRDWDSYRNHTIGFVFQSYNLIPHQTVLSNVELALTISGVSGAERRRRAVEALKQVGLGDQLHKHPTEMSGGQMQRVAIARALVNNPDILLADEPTGALDSETSLQVMELLKEVAKDRLVVMVTHNPELAEQYATRIVKLRDGVIISDTQPYAPDDAQLAPPVYKNMGRASMSLWTSLALSFNNLRTKKARTLLTAFAGSIGIIGIALIISLSQGVNDYIDDMERSTLSEYPLQILSSGMDITSLLSSSNAFTTLTGTQYTSMTVAEEGKIPVKQLVTKMVSGISSNDLTSLKKYLESDECTIRDDATSIEYSYNVSPQIYRQDADGSIRKVNPDSTLSALGISSSSSTNSLMSSMMDTSVFYQLPESSDLYSSQYDVKVGRWPETANECVAVLGKDGSIIDYVLYAMGLRDSAELDKMIQQFAQNQNVDLPQDFRTYSYEDFLGLNFKVVRGADCYEYDETYNIWKDKSEDSDYMKQLVAGGEDLTIVGIVQPKADASAAMLSSGIAYPAALTQHVIEEAKTSAIVQQQMADPTTNVLTGEPFGDSKGLVNSLDLSTIFSVDTDALKHAFSIDPSALNFDLDGAFDLSGGAFDLSSLIDASNFKLDLDALADSLGGMENLPDIDLSEAFAGLDLSISPDALQAFVQKVFKGYKNYIIGNGILNFKKWSFSAYLKSEQFQQLLAESMPDLVDTDAIQGQLTEAVSGVLQTVLESYSDQITDALQTQISAALESSIQSAMGPLMQSFQQNLQTMLEKNLAQLGSQMENAIKIDTKTFQSAIQLNMSTDDLTELMKSTLRSSKSSYEGNLRLWLCRPCLPEPDQNLPPRFRQQGRNLGKAGRLQRLHGSTGSGRQDHPLHRPGGHPDDLRDGDHQYDQQYAGGLRLHLAGGLLHHDRRHHLYQRAGAPERDRHSARHWRFQDERFRGVQRRDVYHRPVLGRHGHRAERDPAHPGQHAHPAGLGQRHPDGHPAAGRRRVPHCAGHPPHHSGGPHPGHGCRQEQPGQGPAVGIKPLFPIRAKPRTTGKRLLSGVFLCRNFIAPQL